jgi:hypothetical protein
MRLLKIYIHINTYIVESILISLHKIHNTSTCHDPRSRNTCAIHRPRYQQDITEVDGQGSMSSTCVCVCVCVCVCSCLCVFCVCVQVYLKGIHLFGAYIYITSSYTLAIYYMHVLPIYTSIITHCSTGTKMVWLRWLLNGDGEQPQILNQKENPTSKSKKKRFEMENEKRKASGWVWCN